MKLMASLATARAEVEAGVVAKVEAGVVAKAGKQINSQEHDLRMFC